jgi:ribosome maturation factor RimP
MQSSVVEQVWKITEPVVMHHGLEIIDIEYRRESHGTILRFFLDREEGGVGLDELAPMSRYLGDVLDVHDVVPTAYVLEVSSPGINRRLRQPQHFRRYIGRRVRIRTVEPQESRRNFLGVLEAVEGYGVVVGDDGGSRFIRFDNIARANYEHEFDGGAKGPNHKGAELR